MEGETVPTLDEASLRDLERLNSLDSHTDIAIVDSVGFRERFLKVLTKDPNIKIYFDRFFGIPDKQNKSYKQVIVSSELQPQIVVSEAAYPCSLIVAYDGKGNVGIVHITQFLILEEFPQEREEAQVNADKAFQELEEFVCLNLAEDKKVIVSATNVGRKYRDRIITSIRDRLKGIVDESQIFYLLSAAGNKLLWENETTTDEPISSVYFIPREFTCDGRNKLFFIGTVYPESQANVEAREWRYGLTSKFPSRTQA